MGNDVFSHNGFTNTVTTNNHITSAGSDWYFAVSAIMTVSAFGFMGLAYLKPRSQRLFYYLNVAISLTSAIAYFAMGSNLGWTAVEVEFLRTDPKVHGDLRQIFYVRYIEWFINVPLVVAQLLLVTGMPTPTILYTLLLSEVAVVSALIGSLVHSSYKWGFFTFGAVADLFVAFAILFDGRAYARVMGADILRNFTILAGWTVSVSMVYPIVWGVSEGGNVIAPDSEAAAYGVLDILAQPVFGAVLIWGLRNVDLERLGINIADNNPRVPRVAKTEKEVEAATAGEAVNTPAVDTTPETAV